MKTLMVLGFECIESGASDSKVYIIRIDNEGEMLEQKVEIEDNGMRLVKRGELEITIGTKSAALIARKLLNYIDGEKVEFPLEVQIE